MTEKVDQKKVDKMAHSMNLYTTNPESAKIFAELMLKAKSTKLMNLLRRRRLHKMRKNRK